MTKVCHYLSRRTQLSVPPLWCLFQATVGLLHGTIQAANAEQLWATQTRYFF